MSIDEDIPQGRMFAAVEHLLDPEYPTIGFVMRSPFPLPMPPVGLRLRDDLSAGDPQQVLFSSEQVEHPSLGNRWAFDYARSLTDAGADTHPLEDLYASWDETPASDWMLTFTTANALPEGPERGHTESVWLLLERCLDAFNDWINAYRVATEAAAVRLLRPEILDEHVIVMVRNEDNAAPVLAGFITMPSLTTPAFRSDVPSDEWFKRIGNLRMMRGHPVNDVVLWKLRADFLSDTVGDYALAVISLQTAAERLVEAIWRTIRVDRGWTARPTPGRRAFGATSPGFKNMLQNISADLGDPWDADSRQGPVATYWSDLYLVRNNVVHEGVEPDSTTLDCCFQGLQALRDWVDERTIATRHEYPRTATLVHSWIGLQKHDAFDQRMQIFMRHIADTGEASDFWLPEDDRIRGQR